LTWTNRAAARIRVNEKQASEFSYSRLINDN
jgi:hypothetical protein